MSVSSVGVDRARELVNRIVQENGFVRESTLMGMSSDARREVEEALLKKDEKIGASVLTLAKDLYTSNARFVFELLQNTDDNQYSAALAANQEPFVSFSLYHNRLVVDCNEDGFTKTNLSAICDIGNSSKSGWQGYIGEKGIGFKSVFMAAWKVHIQSGDLSFSFVHRKGDSGIGMVKPIWEDPTEALPQSNHTRMTLLLHEDPDAEQMSRDREDIRKQFRELEPALLLFVTKLRRIDIIFHDESGQQEWATSLTKRQAQEANRVVLDRRVADAANLDDVSSKSHIYHFTEHMATNIAPHESRNLSDSERRSPSSRRSKIVLAFPVSVDSFPIIEPQKVFAFLPMKQMGFNFLIQADFVTQANREDVVTTSPRNKDLIQGVIDAVMKAIGQFCEHEVLQYTWMRYLPREGTHHWDSFWKTLVQGIKTRLQSEHVVRTREQGALRPISEMRRRAADTNDRYGSPLFPDLRPEMYLSDSYDLADLDILDGFGLRYMDTGEIIKTVRQDLAAAGTPSRLRSSTDKDWHTRASSLLLQPFENDWTIYKAEVRKLRLIPLENGSWVKAVDGDIFYGSVGNILIPKDLGLWIVSIKRAKNARRRALFNSLGVKSADTDMVRSRILDLHKQRDVGDILFEHSLEHLKFLYLTHESRSEKEAAHSLFILDHLNRPRSALHYDLYIQDDHPYGAQSLLGTSAMSSFKASFVNPKYFENAPNTPSGMSVTWVEWMYEYVGVRRNIRLVSRDQTSLSKECSHIAMHKDSKFLGFLKHVWSTQRDAVTHSRDIWRELLLINIPCMHGKKVHLSACYMPLHELRSIQSRFSDADILPFIDIPSPNDASLLSEWSFLTDDLEVSSKNDLEFRLDLLEAFVDHTERCLTVRDASRLLDLYRNIEAWCMGSEDPETMRGSVFAEFQNELRVLAPSFDDGLEDCEWVDPRACLWEAPDSFMTMYSLKALYSRAGMDVDGENIRQFFQGTLCIPNVSHRHIIKELEDMQDEGDEEDVEDEKDEPSDMDTVRNLYRLLQGMYQADLSIAENIRDSFERSSLVYVERQGSSDWYTPSQCLWSSNISIEGKVGINDQYAEFETLFTDVLRVPRVNLPMLYDSLLGAASGGATTERVKELLLTFNALLRENTKRPLPGRLLQRRIFPVKSPDDGDITLNSDDAEFFIVDQDDLFAAFGGRVKCLDFSLQEEVSRVNGNMEWPLRDAKRDIKKKAYGILRVAAKYNSPRFNADPQGLYELLRTAEMVEAEGISSRWVIRQDGEVYDHEVSTSYLHIEERDGSLKIYVPREKGMWDNCFLHTLPRRLLSLMMAAPGSGETPAENFDVAAINVIVVILTCDISTVPDLLKVNGVPEVEDVDEEPLPAPEAASPLTTPTRRAYSSGLSPWSPDALSSSAVTPEPLSSPDNGGASYATPLTDLGDYDPVGYVTVPSPYDRPPGISQRMSQERYKRLLEWVATTAERIALQEYGSADINASFDSLSLDDDDVFTSAPVVYSLPTGSHRHRKIGAAGELFVFELLSKLDPGLPGFRRDNWRSTIRHYATAHPRYSNLTSWVGRETSDIVYDDDAGVLTELLINKGHLSKNQWEDKTPKYYIEVKTTPDRCETPFYVSDGQAEIMRTMTNGASGGDNQHEVYVVFRVFNLGSHSTGLRIYVDPEEQRRTGKLKFTTSGKYAVIPGMGV